MTHPTNESMAGTHFMGFEIRELDGWYVGVLVRSEFARVFEARTQKMLEYKIGRWWVNVR